VQLASVPQSSGAVCCHPGKTVSAKVTVFALLVKVETEKAMHPLSSVCALTPFPVSPSTPVAVTGQCGISGSPESWSEFPFRSLNLQTLMVAADWTLKLSVLLLLSQKPKLPQFVAS
jgi:hypothetical protein